MKVFLDKKVVAAVVCVAVVVAVSDNFSMKSNKRFLFLEREVSCHLGLIWLRDYLPKRQMTDPVLVNFLELVVLVHHL